MVPLDVLLFVSLMPYFSGMSELFYLIVAVILGTGFLFFSSLLMIKPGPSTAMDTLDIPSYTLLCCSLHFWLITIFFDSL